MKGKEKCRALKRIRKAIADSNNIEYAIEECPFQGECKGTCPKCEAELKSLEKELEKRQRMGKAIAIAGVSLSAASFMTGCNFSDTVSDIRYDVNSFVKDIFGKENQDDIVGVVDVGNYGSDDGNEVNTPNNVPDYDPNLEETGEPEEGPLIVSDDYEGGLMSSDELSGDVPDNSDDYCEELEGDYDDLPSDCIDDNSESSFGADYE